MEKYCVRLSAEIGRKLRTEARKASEASGRTVTVSELIRTCLDEKYAHLSTTVRGESGALFALRDEVHELREGVRSELGTLVGSLSEILPLLSTREQVDSITDGIAAVIKAVKESGA